MTDIDPNHLHTVNHDEQQAEQTDKCVICGIPRHSHAKRKLATDIERIKELLPKIGDREWMTSVNEDCVHHYTVGQRKDTGWTAVCTMIYNNDLSRRRMEFIALCRNNIAAMIEENERLKRVADQAHRALVLTAHKTNCRIVGNGCTCGATEEFAAERSEFYRQYNADERLKVALEPAVIGALKSTIAAHGPITMEFVSSAAKRIIGAIRGTTEIMKSPNGYERRKEELKRR